VHSGVHVITGSGITTVHYETLENRKPPAHLRDIPMEPATLQGTGLYRFVPLVPDGRWNLMRSRTRTLLRPAAAVSRCGNGQNLLDLERQVCDLVDLGERSDALYRRYGSSAELVGQLLSRSSR
jgi:hypothetical protein